MSPEGTTAPRLRLRVSAVSDVGRVRKDNQDSGYAGRHLIAVADGVGGAARGDIASSTVIEALRDLDRPPGNDPEGEIGSAVHGAHRRIADVVAEHPEIEGTGTTLTALLFDGARIGVAHVGDSRGYLLREGDLVQFTHDHTFVQGLVDEGRITADEARVHPHRNLILKAVDGLHEPEPDTKLLDVRAGDRIMLCSDGACGVLDDEQLRDLLSRGTVDFAAVELVTASLEAGSSDNVTVVLADVVDENDEDPEETAAVAIGPLLVGAAAEMPRLDPLSARARRAMARRDTGELDPIPAGPRDNEGGDIDPELVRYAPQAPRRFAWLKRVVAIAIVGVLVWFGATAAYAWTQRQYYVAADGDRVAVFQGVEASVPFVDLASVAETTEIYVEDLPEFNQRQVADGLTATDRDDASAIVQRLLLAVCSRGDGPTTPAPSATPSPSPSASPSASPTAGQRQSPSPSPSASPSDEPSAQPELRTDCEGVS